MQLKRFSTLVEALYQSALDPAGWQRIAPLIANLFDSPNCKFQFQDLAGTRASVLAATANYDARSNADYEAHYFATDPCVAGAKRMGVGRTVLTQEIISIPELLETELYNDYSKRIGVYYLVGAMLPVGDNAIGGIGIHRPYGADEFDAQDKTMLGLLVPHLTRALQLHARINGLERDRRIGFEALEAMTVGVMVVTATGYLLFANRVADALLRTGDGITVSHGMLRATHPGPNSALWVAIRDASWVGRGQSVRAGGILPMPRTGAAPLTLLVSPAPFDALGMTALSPAAIIFVNNPDDRITPTEAALATQFRLTPAEARLTTALLDGEHIEDYAVRTGLSPHTVKTQLKAVFAKTGCGRQSDLMRVVLTNPVLRMCRQG